LPSTGAYSQPRPICASCIGLSKILVRLESVRVKETIAHG
jgi:hypothetical protein